MIFLYALVIFLIVLVLCYLCFVAIKHRKKNDTKTEISGKSFDIDMALRLDSVNNSQAAFVDENDKEKMKLQ